MLSEAWLWPVIAVAAFCMSVVMFGLWRTTRRERNVALDLAEFWKSKAADARAERFRIEGEAKGLTLRSGPPPMITRVVSGGSSRLRLRRGEGGD